MRFFAFPLFYFLLIPLISRADAPYTLQGGVDDSKIQSSQEMMKVLAYMHDHYGPVTLASGARSAGQQQAIRDSNNCGARDCSAIAGGANTSQHVVGIAADVGVNGLQGEAFCKALVSARNATGVKGGVGVYSDEPNSGHIDLRGRNVGWNMCQSIGTSAGVEYASPVVAQYANSHPGLFGQAQSAASGADPFASILAAITSMMGAK